MSKKIDLIKGYSGANPFRDHQARTFNKAKLIREFCPTSTFWSLFNDQHEVLIGRRGSGKTFLLKMMRYSLLKEIDHETAREITREKKYFGITVSTSMEFLGDLLHQEIPKNLRIPFFQFSFNCMISRAFLFELMSVVKEEGTFVERGRLSMELTSKIVPIWFPDYDNSSIRKLEDLDNLIVKTYSAVSPKDKEINAPYIFQKPICSTIQAVSSAVTASLNLDAEPTWLVCIDEAEFLPKIMQRCINTLFRADSGGIVIKVATLPYHHLTKETLSPGRYAESNGNDFSYRNIDMYYKSDDFINVTNNLCRTRLSRSIAEELPEEDTLETFVGKVGHDDLIDYFKTEFNIKKTPIDTLYPKILEQLSEVKRKKTTKSKKILRKEIYDKYAPIYFYREMYKLSKQGRKIPGWYAGAKNIRKIAEGNPRRFIKLMNELFEAGKSRLLNVKRQHEVIYNFVEKESKSSKALPVNGPHLHEILDEIASRLKSDVHDRDLFFKGNSFCINKDQLKTDTLLIESLKLGVAYLHIDVDKESLLDDISENTIFSLSNAFSAYYWIPMRAGDRPRIKLSPRQNSLFMG